ncbi:MAG: hypothetical protein A2513_09110 [Sulfurimonas sp. RIFOXYD12_FULL_33_39]|uniref:ABC-type transport auxiliary lipoprotein family protein n=1 Tax=unclassified Sulfurimonas TaxID=2623549 RepID=UPI0008ADB7A1|nr:MULTISPECIES: ABC-type transport auxiliary lipoprotein family protein [unclassified Sulfurimonas]OHE05305.1 MAG: hypothetical protein A3G74_03275 [Sulfurimonas sp. RIFCSPLOWO2_12_FULL_34_6]OHE10238.1 MAG: hypothetical protein A2513_09110 [Sulfurimonas sp. RIFOXYD12_FULL_33_39]OHE14541.1 MAG: hypothetical protein A2530_01370 [Sulfurimonas sp. RIFOXYD2_FULL_34_21]
MRTVLIILVVFLSGCATIKPAVAEYRVVTQVQKKDILAKGCKNKSLKILEAFSTNSLKSLSMDYTESGNRVFSYSESQWQESPNNFVISHLISNIRAQELFSSVNLSKSRSKNSLLLETAIEEFMQFYSSDLKSSYVDIVITFTLVDSSTNAVMATKTFYSKVNAKTPDAQGGVDAINSALSEIISQNINWLEEVCK